jgi:DNA (cytosine-5)-methyltransferase 1
MKSLTLFDMGPEAGDFIGSVITLKHSVRNGIASRHVHFADGSHFAVEVRTSRDASAVAGDDAANIFDLAWLTSKEPLPEKGESIRSVDLFSGCGGLSLGSSLAAATVGAHVVSVAAFDFFAAALEVHQRNFGTEHLCREPIETVFDGSFGDTPTATERAWKRKLGKIDLVLAGPPCQGHSDLNNHSRRDDPKNQLYFRCARVAEVLNPKVVLIENVPGSRHDKSGVVDRTRSALESLGYNVSSALLDATHFGIPQARKRFFLVARRQGNQFDLAAEAQQLRLPVRNVSWALSDLDVEPERGVFGTPATHSATNQARIKYLFDHDLYELPNSQRPDCHRLKKHSYLSVYGRMHSDRPSPTITGGFGSTGQGRFVHPLHPRTLTPHEAARLQGFPDSFDFGSNKRVDLQTMIGNAVPSQLAWAALATSMKGITE